MLGESGQGSIDTRDLERGMGHNRTSQGAKLKEGLSPFKGLQRGDGRLWPYPCETRWIFPPTALKSPHGDRHHIGLFALSATKSNTRHARNPSVDTA